MSFRFFSVERRVLVEDEKAVALRIRFELVPLWEREGQAADPGGSRGPFGLRVEEVELAYARAEIPAPIDSAFGCVASCEQSLNLHVEVQFLASWVTERGEVHRGEVVGVFSGGFPGLHIDPSHPGYRAERDRFQGRWLDGYLLPPPRSHIPCPDEFDRESSACFDRGLVSIVATVTETTSREEWWRLVEERGTDALRQASGSK